MLLDLLEDTHEIRRICIMGRNCTLEKENDVVECSVPSEKQIAERKLQEGIFIPDFTLSYNYNFIFYFCTKCFELTN